MNRPVFCLVAVTVIMAVSVRWVMADGMCIFPTSTKEVAFAPEWHGKLEIHAEKLTIDCGESIALWCTSKEGIPCPKFSWSVSGTGFYLGAIGSKTGETEAELEIIQLLADANACGTATITVTDQCGESREGWVRSTEGGWVYVSDECVLSDSESYYQIGPDDPYAPNCNGLEFHFQKIYGHRKQHQITCAGYPDYANCDSVPAICAAYADSECGDYANCLDGDFKDFYPFICDPSDGFYRCFCVHTVKYYEWKCSD